MKITPSILSIPPYISTTWGNISTLHVREEKGLFTLIITLQNSNQIEVPSLQKGIVEAIFEAHTKTTETSTPQKDLLKGPFHFNLPLNAENLIGDLESSMQHNPEFADAPKLPPEILTKISTIARAFELDTDQLPKAEPHCNCVYCQVSRSLLGVESLEEVTEEDLTFRNWEIKQTDKQLYTVTNPLDETEEYNVFLGTPLGCTCGSKNCEHIHAVLTS